MAMLTPDLTSTDQLAYARLIIREALRHGRQGWRDYGRAFCQQSAADHTLPWNTLLPRHRRQLSSGKDGGRVQHFVPYAEMLIAFGPQVPCSTFSHLLVGPHLLILSRAPSKTFVCPGTRVRASSPPTAPIGPYALPISFSTRRKTAPTHLNTPYITTQTNVRR